MDRTDTSHTISCLQRYEMSSTLQKLTWHGFHANTYVSIKFDGAARLGKATYG